VFVVTADWIEKLANVGSDGAPQDSAIQKDVQDRCVLCRQVGCVAISAFFAWTHVSRGTPRHTMFNQEYVKCSLAAEVP
jgi:hypothetical protein